MKDNASEAILMRFCRLCMLIVLFVPLHCNNELDMRNMGNGLPTRSVIGRTGIASRMHFFLRYGFSVSRKCTGVDGEGTQELMRKRHGIRRITFCVHRCWNRQIESFDSFLNINQPLCWCEISAHKIKMIFIQNDHVYDERLKLILGSDQSNFDLIACGASVPKSEISKPLIQTYIHDMHTHRVISKQTRKKNKFEWIWF